MEATPTSTQIMFFSLFKQSTDTAFQIKKTSLTLIDADYHFKINYWKCRGYMKIFFLITEQNQKEKGFMIKPVYLLKVNFNTKVRVGTSVAKQFGTNN